MGVTPCAADLFRTTPLCFCHLPRYNIPLNATLHMGIGAVFRGGSLHRSNRPSSILCDAFYDERTLRLLPCAAGNRISQNLEKPFADSSELTALRFSTRSSSVALCLSCCAGRRTNV